MKNIINRSIRVLTIILIPLLLSCATTQQKQGESRDAEFYNSRGIAYGEKGQYDQAILDFNKALEINPKFAGAYYNRGITYGRKGQHDQAILDFSKALEINPTYAEAYTNRGVAYYFKKEYDKSWEDVEKAQNLGYQIPSKFLESLLNASEKRPQSDSLIREGSFKIAAGEVKTVYVEREGEKYKIVRVEDGEKKEKGTIVFRYIYKPSTQILEVESHVEELRITYDCFQILDNKARKTSVIGAFKDVPAKEIWSDGIKLLLIENIRVAR